MTKSVHIFICKKSPQPQPRLIPSPSRFHYRLHCALPEMRQWCFHNPRSLQRHSGTETMIHLTPALAKQKKKPPSVPFCCSERFSSYYTSVGVVCDEARVPVARAVTTNSTV
ncbi:uncharacterized [Tachysurus ichikawai]